MKSWKTTLGGSLSALGTTLVGIGVVPQLGGTPSKLLTYTAVVGYFIDAVGKFFAHLYAADSGVVPQASADTNSNPPSPAQPPVQNP